jgi:hypothetical protein
MKARFPLRDEGVTAVVGVVLLVGIVIILCAVAAILWSQFEGNHPAVDSGGRASFTSAGYQVTLAGPEDIPVTPQARIITVIDGNETSLPLSDFASQLPDPTVWKVGDLLCIVGPPPCPIPDGEAVGVRLVVDHGVVFDLPPLQFVAAGSSFLVQPGGGIGVQCNLPTTLKVIGQEFTYNGDDPPVSVGVSTTGSGPFTTLFGGADVDGGETYVFSSLPAGSVLGVQGILDADGFDRTYDSYNGMASDGRHVYVLKNGDPVPNYDPVSGQTAIAVYLDPYVSADGSTIELSTNEVIILFEFYHLNTSGADFQDLVVLFQFSDTFC